MQEVLMMVMAGCPHCRRAKEMMEALFERNPIFRTVPLRVVDETLEPDFAATLDYYYVPTFYVGPNKRHEGVPTEEAIEAVFAEALATEA